MFVIIQCWETLTEEQKKQSHVKKFGLTMQHAGTAITVTSVTDVIAFATGGFTVLPALRSFCIYASLGIVAIYIFQCTFFFAIFSLDQRRQDARRNAFSICFVHKEDYKPNTWSQTNIQKYIFEKVSIMLTNIYVKIIVLVITAIMLGIGLWGNVLLKQKFDPAWFLPPGTYLADWFKLNRELFPAHGERVTIYFNDINLPMDLDKVESLVNILEAKEDILHEMDSWTTKYTEWMNKNQFLQQNKTINQIDESLFRTTLVQWLYSPGGAPYQGKFTFDSEIKCGKDAPDIHLFEITFTHQLFNGPKESIPAMNAVKKAIKDYNFTGRVFAEAIGYAAWETDEVISFELYRNILMALVCVLLVTLFFICDFVGATIIIGSVLFTLVNVGGYMHFWNLTIDTVSCINLIIAIGLCVDYSAHIVHRFLGETGSRNDRVMVTVQNMGPAVFDGGFSTFLAVILLSMSQSHVFITFFKIFFLVVFFGLYHGLVFLPVVLTIFGPANDLKVKSAD